MGEPASDSAAAPPSHALRRRRLWLCAGVLAVALAADLGTKAWAVQTLQDQPPIVIRKGLFLLDFAFNTGAAFGTLAESDWARAFFIAITSVACVYLARLAWTLPPQPRASFVAVGLIAGGALGNLHDRLFRAKALRTTWSELSFSDLLEHADAVARAIAGARPYVEIERYGVVDFIVVYYWPQHRWPAFNVADAALCVGVGLFLLYLQRQRPPAPRPEAQPGDR